MEAQFETTVACDDDGLFEEVQCVQAPRNQIGFRSFNQQPSCKILNH